MRKLLLYLMLMLLSAVMVACGANTEDYKKDAQTFTFIDFADGKVSGSTKVQVTGKVSNTEGETLILSDNDGVYYVKNEDVNKTKLNEEDTITVYGVYVGDDSQTGFPKIVGKVFEK